MRPSKIFTAIAFGALLLFAGCNHPVATSPDGVLKLEAEEAATVSGLSAERWQIVQLPESRLYIAGIRGAEGRGSMLVSCETQSDTLVASIVLHTHLSGDASRRSVALLFDEGGGFASPTWTTRAQTSSAPSAFDIVYDYDYYTYAHGFWHHITNLKKHDEVVAVVREDAVEVSRYKFSLIGAQMTIDAAVHRCGQPKPW